jgi:hypothetical protein
MFNKKDNNKKHTPHKKSEEPLSRGEWMQKYWRPCCAFMYMICCLADFAVFPIMFTVVQFWETQAANDAFRQWVPITLRGGGLFHVSMCAVLGVSAYGRTQEKLNGTAGQPMGMASPTLSSATPQMGGMNLGGNSMSTAGFGGTGNAGFNTQTTAFGASAPATGGGFGSSATGGGFGATPAGGGFGSTDPNAGFGASSPTGFGSTDPNAGFGSQPIATTASGKKIVPDYGQPLI